VKRSQKLREGQIRELNAFIKNRDCSGREVRRAQAVLLVNQDTSAETITALTGYKHRQIFALRKECLTQGIVALKDKRKGVPRELLTKKQRDELLEKLENTAPENYGYQSDYWTTSILANYTERQYGIRYKSKTSYYLIFRRAKFTYHKPGRVYHERNEEEVEQWKNETKPRIQAALRDTNTVILAEDEMILSTQTTTQKIWLKQGEYPKIEVSNKRQNRSIYGFLNIKNGSEHAWKTERQNMETTNNILEKMRKTYPTQKILLLWDSASWHRGRAVAEFIKQDGEIKTVHFPRYAPEENPQEHVWKRGRSQVTHNRFIEDIDAATDEFAAYLNREKFRYDILGFSAVS
jgi:transposase